MTKTQLKKLKRAVVDALMPQSVKDVESQLTTQTNLDLEHNQGVQCSTMLVLERDQGIKLNQNDFRIQLHRLDEYVFEVETDLGKILAMDEVTVNSIVTHALLGIGALNQRIFEMEVYDALSGFISEETPLFSHKVDILLKSLCSNNLEPDLDRVIKLKQFPGIVDHSCQTVNVEKLLEVRESNKVKIFRDWLQQNKSVSDDDILQELGSIRSKLGVSIHSGQGKSIRFLATSLVGLIPGIGSPIGMLLGAADSFLLDKFLPNSEVLAFVDQLYPSIFKSST